MEHEPHRRFDHFSPDDYLREYYSEVGPENCELLRFFAEVSSVIPPGGDLLEYGGGPTIYQLLSLAPVASSIVFADYLTRNLDVVKCWLEDLPSAHDWAAFASAALEHEGLPPTQQHIRRRLDLVRQRIVTLEEVDVLDHQRSVVRPEGFAIVSTNFVAEAAASTHDEWRRAVGAIARNLRRDGHLVMTAIRNAHRWRVADSWYPALPIQVDDVRSALHDIEHDIEYLAEIDAEVTDPGDPLYEGYDGMIFCLSRRRGRGSAVQLRRTSF